MAEGVNPFIFLLFHWENPCFFVSSIEQLLCQWFDPERGYKHHDIFISIASAG
jgi:hypothetical protein